MKKKTIVMISGIIVVVLIIAVIIALVALKGPRNENKNLNYISYDQDECVKILFTCPQYQKQFIDGEGCGCALSTDKTDNPDSRSIERLVKSYLENRIFKPENKGGVVLAEFVAIGLEKSNKELKYETWAEIREYYYNAKDERTFTVRQSGPVILDITETGKNYIIHDNKLVDGKDENALKQELTAKAFEWYSNKDAFKKTTDLIDQYLQKESDGMLINNRIRVRVNQGK